MKAKTSHTLPSTEGSDCGAGGTPSECHLGVTLHARLNGLNLALWVLNWVT